MARPSRDAEAELERLESLAASLSALADDARLLHLRLRQARLHIGQVERRVRGQPYMAPIMDRLRDVVDPGTKDASRLAGAVADCQQILADLLDAKQQERIRQNNGSN